MICQNHYVYQIKNILAEKYYIGVRSCNIAPVDDLGKKYFSSSSDKNFMNDQKENPENYRYKILEEFDSRSLAVKEEIKLHKKFNVSKNNIFYNLASQTADGFDWDSTGLVNAFNIKENCSGAWSAQDFHNDRNNYICSNDNKITAFNISENKSGLWPIEDFYNSRGNYIMVSDNKVAAFNISENKSGLWPKEEFDNNRDNYITVSKDTIIVYNIQDDKFCRIPLDIFYNNKHNYLTPNSNAYKLLQDPKFKALPHNDKDYIRCFDKETLGVVMFLKSEAKTRDKTRFINANSSRKKTMVIKNKRKLIPSKELPKPIIWVN